MCSSESQRQLTPSAEKCSCRFLYEDAILNEGAVISSNGALINFSGKKTGRSPKDKRIVFEETSKDDVWWGPVNIKME